jgi:streptomycin 6-kinase
VTSSAVEIPSGFRRHAVRTFGAAGRAWIQALPARLHHYLATWDLTVDLAGRREPWYGLYGIVVPVRTPDGTPAVLKVSVPDDENVQEHLALATWGGADGWPSTRSHSPAIPPSASPR